MPTLSPFARRLALKGGLIVLVNLALWLLFSSLATLRLHVRIEARGAEFTAALNGKALPPFTNTAFSAGAIGFKRPAVALYAERGVAEKEEALAAVSVTDLEEKPLFAASFADQNLTEWALFSGAWRARSGQLVNDGSGLITTRKYDFQNFVFDVDIIGSRPVDILLRSPNGKDGIYLSVQPEKDLCWYTVTAGVPSVPVNCQTYDLKSPSAIRSIARILRATHEKAMFLGGGALAFSLGLGALMAGLWWLGGQVSGKLRPSLQERKGKSALARAWNGRCLTVGSSVAVFLAAFSVLSWVSLNLYDGIPHVQDAISTLFQAQIFAEGALSAPSPPFSRFFDFEMIVNRQGKWYSKYQPVHSLVLVPWLKAGMPWLANPFFSALALVAIMLLVLEICGRWNALLCAFLGLTSPFFLFLGASYMSHTTTMLFLAVFVWLFAAARKRGDWVMGFLAGGALGMAANDRALSALAVAAPFGVLVVWDLFHHPRRKEWAHPFHFFLGALTVALGAVWVLQGKPLTTSYAAMAGVLGLAYLAALLWFLNGKACRAYLPLAAALVPFLALTLEYNRLQTGDPFLFPLQAYSSADRLGFGPDVGWLGGHSPAKGLENVKLNLESLVDVLFGWEAVVTLAFLMIPLITLAPSLWDWLLFASFGSLVTAYFFWWYHGLYLGPRFWYEALPMLLYLTGKSAIRIAEGYQHLRKVLSNTSLGPYWPGAWLPLVVVTGLMGSYMYPSATGYFPTRAYSTYKNYNGISGITLKNVASAGITKGLCLVARSPIWQDWGQVFLANDPWLRNQIIFGNIYGDDRQDIEALIAAYPDRPVYLIEGTKVKPFRLEETLSRTPEKARFDTSPFLGGKGLGHGQFDEPRGMAVAPDGTLYVADFRNYRVQVFTPEGKFLREWGARGNSTGQFEDPATMAVAPDGNVCVLDTFNNRVQRFTPEGAFLNAWGSFYYPRGLAIDGAGYFYVANTEIGEVVKCDHSGTIVTTWGKNGTRETRLRRPNSLCLSGKGDSVFVVDQAARSIHRYSLQGAPETRWTIAGSEQSLGEPYCACDGLGNIYVSDTGRSRILKYTEDGAFLGEFGRQGIEKGAFNQPAGLAIGPEGTLYVVDTWNHRIQKFSKTERP